MAHFKRRKARINARNNWSWKHAQRRAAYRNQEPKPWYRQTPSAWNIRYHTRPRRAQDRQEIQRIMHGKDPDDAIFALSKKPHHYYW